MMTSIVADTDRWVIRCKDYTTAYRYAQRQKWEPKEWSWMPAYTMSENVQIFERKND